MTDDKQDPSVVAWVWRMRVRLNSVSDWGSWSEWGIGKHNCTDTDYAQYEEQQVSLTSDLTAMKAELEEAKKERDQAVSENDTGTDALLAAIDAHLALEDEIMACETFDVFLVLQARLRLQREADVAATKVTVERALDRFKQGRALSKPKPHDEGGLRSISEDGK